MASDLLPGHVLVHPCKAAPQNINGLPPSELCQLQKYSIRKPRDQLRKVFW